jgi:hypothetical protein
MPNFQVEAFIWIVERIPTANNLGFLDRTRYFSFKCHLIYCHEAEWTPLQTHYFSENLVALGIEQGNSGCAVRKADYWTTAAVVIWKER